MPGTVCIPHFILAPLFEGKCYSCPEDTDAQGVKYACGPSGPRLILSDLRIFKELVVFPVSCRYFVLRTESWESDRETNRKEKFQRERAKRILEDPFKKPPGSKSVKNWMNVCWRERGDNNKTCLVYQWVFLYLIFVLNNNQVCCLYKCEDYKMRQDWLFLSTISFIYMIFEQTKV